MGILSGLRVTELTPNIVGRYACQVLADLGAEVTAVGRPEDLALSEAQVTVGRNKRSIVLDLKGSEGREILHRILADCDVLVEGFRPGVVDRLGFGASRLRARHPRLIYCSLSGYGQTGPYAQWPGHDLNYQGVAGSVQLDENGQPVLPTTNLSDRTASMNLVVAALAGLYHRERTGAGSEFDVALIDGSLMLPSAESFGRIGYQRVLNGGPPGSEAPPSRITSTEEGIYPCYQVYECADHRFLSLCAVEEHFWQRLCDLFGRDDWRHEQFADSPRRDVISAGMRTIFRTLPRQDWIERLRSRDLPVAPVNIGTEALADPQIRHRESFVRTELPSGERMWQIAIPFRSPSVELDTRRPVTVAGQHSHAILAELGYSPDEVAVLAEAGVVGLAAVTPSMAD